MVHVFNLQGSTGGHRCYLNLGAHLDFLPGGPIRMPDKRLEYECEFRDRIRSTTNDHAWPYGDTQEQCEATALSIVAAWESQGRPWFARVSRWPEDFAKLVDCVRPGRGPSGRGTHDGDDRRSPR